MKRFATLLLATACLAPPGSSAQAAGADDGLGSLEGLVGEWIDLREKIAAERQAWNAQQARWSEEIAVLEAEKATLTREIRESREITSSAKADRERIAAQREAMHQVVQALTPAVDRAEALLRRWHKRLPPLLVAPLRKALDALPTTPGEARQTTVARRIQGVIALYSQIEAIQHGIHVVPEIVPLPGGIRREVDVLYIGLARGFAVSIDDEWAAVGIPTDSGWEWSPRPELVATVRKAINIAGGTAPAQLVDLPLGLVPARRNTGTDGAEDHAGRKGAAR